MTTLPTMHANLDYYENLIYTYSFSPNDSISYENVSQEILSQNATGYRRQEATVINISIMVICIFGAVGNGAVIWFLGFRIKRNPFSTYILNLAIADLGVLLSSAFQVLDLCVTFDYGYIAVYSLFLFLFLSMYSTSQFLLMAISIDRCVAVFFPLWHRCHRPPHLSTVVCALIWALSLLLTSISLTLLFQNMNEPMMGDYYQFFVNATLCLPVMMMATAALFIKVCFKPGQQRRGKLVTIILLALLLFLLFAFPMNVMIILDASSDYFPLSILRGSVLLACLNSSVNPAIYILIGRRWKSRQRENVKIILEKVFKEEEETSMETQL